MPFFFSSVLLFSSQVERLRRELAEAEESRDAGRRELIEAHRQLRECIQERDAQRRESLELKRALGDEGREREAIHTSNQELRAAVKRAESDNNRFNALQHTNMLIFTPAYTFSPSYYAGIGTKVKTSMGVF